jgi:hypothetical protein
MAALLEEVGTKKSAENDSYKIRNWPVIQLVSNLKMEIFYQ